MTRETARELLTPYLDGELDPGTRALLEDYLATDPIVQQELEQLRELFAAIESAPAIEPDPGLLQDLHRVLDAEKQRARTGGSGSGGGRVSTFPRLAWFAAAAACLAVGLAIGWQVATQRGEQVIEAEREETFAEVDALRRDVDALRSALFGGALFERSASYRLQTMNLASELPVSDPDIVHALLTTLESDPSANVRLAALEALRRFQHEPPVRSALVDTLERQTDPLVQIAVIGVLIDAGATEAREPLKNLLADPGVQPVVKGTAQRGLTLL